MVHNLDPVVNFFLASIFAAAALSSPTIAVWWRCLIISGSRCVASTFPRGTACVRKIAFEPPLPPNSWSDMRERVTITTLVENSVNVAGRRAEHGFSLLVRSGCKKLRFDTGQSDLLVPNAQKMGLVLDDVEAVVLSHGHYDHAGGIETICQSAPLAMFYAHPSVLGPNFAPNSDRTSRVSGLFHNLSACSHGAQKA
jgi:hypothetical protein